MAKEYIEREGLREAMKHVYQDSTCPMHIAAEVDQYITEAPAADVVEVKHGRWTLHDDGSGTCDQCHFTQKHIWDDDGWQNYCGVCGADMRERRDNNAK